MRQSFIRCFRGLLEGGGDILKSGSILILLFVALFIGASIPIMFIGNNGQIASLEEEVSSLETELAKYRPDTQSVEKVNYTWKDGGIQTSDGRFYPLKRANIVDDKGNPIIIMEAKTTGGDATEIPTRDKMDVNEIVSDFWYRVQDQDLKSLGMVPSRFDNEGDLRKVLVTITDKEAEHLDIDMHRLERYRLNNPTQTGAYNKLAIPMWFLLKSQQEVQKVDVKEDFKDKVGKLRKAESSGA